MIKVNSIYGKTISVLYDTPITPPEQVLKVSILCIGDSITAGSNGPTYRSYLGDMLSEQGFEVEWKGTITNSEWTCSEPCMAWPGSGPRDISNKYYTAATENNYANLGSIRADVVLVHANHNMNLSSDDYSSMTFDDFKNTTLLKKNMYGSGDSSPLGLGPLVKSIKARDKNALGISKIEDAKTLIFVAQSILANKPSEPAKYSYIPLWNREIPNMCASYSPPQVGSGSNVWATPVIPVNMADGWDVQTHCIADGVHPNEIGARLMAQKWCDAICENRSIIASLPKNNE